MHPVVGVKPVNDEPTWHEIPVVVVVTVLQLAVEQHVYVIPVPLSVVLVGHVDVSAHEYVVVPNTDVVYLKKKSLIIDIIHFKKFKLVGSG